VLVLIELVVQGRHELPGQVEVELRRFRVVEQRVHIISRRRWVRERPELTRTAAVETSGERGVRDRSRGFLVLVDGVAIEPDELVAHLDQFLIFGARGSVALDGTPRCLIEEVNADEADDTCCYER